jgi:hypothetical protein
LRQNIQDLFRQMQAGTLTAEQLGGLTAQEFLDQLTSTIGLLDEVDAGLGTTVDGLQRTVEMLRAFSDSLKLDANLSTLSPVQKLDEARQQYEKVLAAAQGGDAAAAGQLPEAARAFLEASRAVNASGAQYAADFARVLAQTEALIALLDPAGRTDPIDDVVDNTGQMVRHTGDMVNSTQQTVDRLESLIAVQAEGMQKLIDQLDGLKVEMAENTRITRLGFEGATL